LIFQKNFTIFRQQNTKHSATKRIVFETSVSGLAPLHYRKKFIKYI